MSLSSCYQTVTNLISLGPFLKKWSIAFTLEEMSVMIYIAVEIKIQAVARVNFGHKTKIRASGFGLSRSNIDIRLHTKWRWKPKISSEGIRSSDHCFFTPLAFTTLGKMGPKDFENVMMIEGNKREAVEFPEWAFASRFRCDLFSRLRGFDSQALRLE